MTRLGVWNVEWFAHLFDRDGRMLDDAHRWAPGAPTRSARLGAIGAVMRAVDADAWVIVEAPDTSPGRDTRDQLQVFAHRFGLRATTATMGPSNDTRQEIALLFDPAVILARPDPGLPSLTRPDGPGRFSKPPMELAVEARGRAFRILGAHLKSKSVESARTPAQALECGIANRRRQQAQADRLRARIDAIRAGGEEVALFGDLNDGPWRDEIERVLGRSTVEILAGDDLHDPNITVGLPTAGFAREGAAPLEVPVDWALLSAGLARGAAWHIWSPGAEPDLAAALTIASDHWPVTVDLPD
ncbi:MAG: endonuclease/exonuclease/phosphatase family protein [Paracoccaceae bacterium]